MTTTRGAGRPRAASRALLEEAACELFLEQGFAATSVAEVTARAGVSRSTFFNYFDTKSDLLWAVFDDQVAALSRRLGEGDDDGDGDGDGDGSPMGDDADVRVRIERELVVFAGALGPDNVALAFSQDAAMGLGEELRLAAVRRLADVRDVVASALRQAGGQPLAAEVVAAGYAGALLAAVRIWSVRGPGRTDLVEILRQALGAVGR